MTPGRLLEAASFRPRSLRFPDAWAGHLPFAAWVIRELSPRTFVELGTHSGNSYFSFCQSVLEADLPTRCHAVDTWQGDDHAGHYGSDVFAEVSAHNAEHYAAFSRLLHMTFDEAAAQFPDGSVDLLHIDGLHTYEAVRHDFETWLPRLAPGAVVLLHDVTVRERGFGVWKLWEELRERYPDNLLFPHSHGLGVLRPAGGDDTSRLEWLRPGAPERQELVEYFAALGSLQLARCELNELKQHVADLSQIAAERAEQIVALNQAVSERDGILRELSSSTSWRLTRPLRAARELFRRR